MHFICYVKSLDYQNSKMIEIKRYFMWGGKTYTNRKKNSFKKCPLVKSDQFMAMYISYKKILNLLMLINNEKSFDCISLCFIAKLFTLIKIK